MQKELLAANYRRVLDRAAAAADRAGRPPGSFTLVAVTKSVSTPVASDLFDLGARDLGENRVSNLLEKAAALAGKPINWHMIGHLQSRKAKDIVGRACLIHSVDSLSLATKIDSVAATQGITQDILLEVNISAEESKYGIAPHDAPSVAAEVSRLENVRLLGLMTMAPIVDNPEDTRPVFKSLKNLADDISAAGYFARQPYHLSMGMTQDFEIAIQEGATLVRVGSALYEGLQGGLA